VVTLSNKYVAGEGTVEKIAVVASNNNWKRYGCKKEVVVLNTTPDVGEEMASENVLLIGEWCHTNTEKEDPMILITFSKTSTDKKENNSATASSGTPTKHIRSLSSKPKQQTRKILIAIPVHPIYQQDHQILLFYSIHPKTQIVFCLLH
jgi:hypothetical protein